jgi:hypothetical protein
MHCARWLTGFLAVLLSIAGCGGPDGGGSVAEVGSASHSWNGYHWARTANPFTLKLGDNVSPAWDGHLVTASSDWSASDVLDTLPVAGQSNRNCKPTSGRVEVCDARYGYNGWLGIATVWITNSVHITQGSVKMNDSYFSSGTYNTPEWRQLVMCQEIGHTLGLDHQDENFDNPPLGTCMDYTSDPVPNQHPNQHDYEELDIIYAHLDSTTTLDAQRAPPVAALPPQASDGADPDDVGPPAWGTLVHRSPDGKLETYVLELGAGNKVVRFVRKP